MKNLQKAPFCAMILMAALSFTNLFGVNIAGAAVVVGVLFFFLDNVINKLPANENGLERKAIKTSLKGRGIWLWILLPLIMDAVSIAIGKLFVPDYIEHVLVRTEIFLSFDKFLLMLFQLAFLALGEEIAWRAFFQKQLVKALPLAAALALSSFLFAIGHIVKGDPIIVIYDVFFVFLNSVLYGIIFQKTKNAWVSAISHFVANLFSVIVLLIL